MDGLFTDGDWAWLGGPHADRLAACHLETRGEGAGLAVVARDHRALQAASRNPRQGSVRTVRVERAGGMPDDGFVVERDGESLHVRAGSDAAVVRGFLALWVHGVDHIRVGDWQPATEIRMLNDWDNMSHHPVMGPVERGYSGASVAFADGEVRSDLSRFRDYVRLVAACGINALCVNNVNVDDVETTLIMSRRNDLARLAGILLEYGITPYVAVNFASPLTVGATETADPLDPDVRRWWAKTTAEVFDAIDGFGGFVVKADSENRPGPFQYGRNHVEGANMLAEALAPHGGRVFWRCFVYNHLQDWRDRSTDRARAAADHFAPLDGQFAQNVVLQVKHGPMDFQTREPVSPLLTRLRDTNIAVELQVTQEYTGQQRHLCYLPPMWREVLDFGVGWEPDGGPCLWESLLPGARPLAGLTAVSNVGMDWNWTGHALAQANLYGYCRLAWDPSLDPADLLDEWIAASYDLDEEAAAVLRRLMLGSWRTYEDYTAPLGVGFMVSPGHHYGPSVDGYEYSPWGTYHFADRDGVGVDRTVATGTGMVGQYPDVVAERYERLEDCPDELVLFFHHVPYTHVLNDGRTVVQHIYDTHFEGVEKVEAMMAQWSGVRDRFPAAVRDNVDVRLAEQLRSATEWRDQVNTYFLRKSGIPDERGRPIHP